MEITPEKKWALSQIVYTDVLRALDYHFQKISIEYIPIKGAYLLCTGLAERMRERKICDVDILVQEKDMRIVSDYFTALDETVLKQYYTDNYRPTETSFIYKLSFAEVTVEIHSQINFSQRFLLPTIALFRRASKSGLFRSIPSCEDSILIFLCHLQTHIAFEFRKTTLDELHTLIVEQKIDWKVFWCLSLKTGIDSFNYFMLRYFERKYRYPIHAPRYYFYSDILARAFTKKRYERLPGWAKRVFFDVPFVRNPWWLVCHKIVKKVEVPKIYER